MKVFRTVPFVIPENPAFQMQLERFRAGIEDGGRRIENAFFLDGSLTDSVALTSGSNVTIYHGLGRVPKGWLVTRAVSSAPSLYEVSRNAETLVLRAGNTGTADIWVY